MLCFSINTIHIYTFNYYCFSFNVILFFRLTVKNNLHCYWFLSFPRKHYGEYHPLLGILYLKLGKINLYLKKLSEARNMLKNAEIVISVTHGDRHALYQEQLLPLVHQTEAEMVG